MRSYAVWIFLGLAGVLGLIIHKLESFEPMPRMVRYSETDRAIEGATRLNIFFGTRPEIIKLAPVIRMFRSSVQFNVVTIFTGQHPDLIKPFLDMFDIKVDFWFDNVLQQNQSINNLVSKIIVLTNKLKSQKSDIWMVQGDTSTAYAIATVAFHRGIRIAHVEAGLRTYNMYSPFPEEFNRKTISSIATFHFAPTQKNKKILLREGVPEDHIFVTGNTVLDAVKYLLVNNKTQIPVSLRGVNLQDKILVLITLHRRENINIMPELYSTIQNVPCKRCLFLVPVHPNPNAGEAAADICKREPERFLCSDPLSYEQIHWVMTRSQFILTDSGGLQEEATWHHVPVLVLRTSTERMEAVESGVAALVGQDMKVLEKQMSALLDKSKPLWKTMSRKRFPFGYGNASEQIMTVLERNKKYPTRSVILNPSDSLVPENPTRSVTSGQSDTLAPENLQSKVFSPDTIGVVLQVFKRNTLQVQLEAAAKQTLAPSTVVVLQNGHHVDVSSIIQKFRVQHPHFEVQHIASSKNLRFHGRFYLAYMLRETYVSVWDDDVLPGSKWLEHCVKVSKAHKNALVGGNGRSFIELQSLRGGKTYKMKQRDSVGRQDFVGHTWTLPREFLKYYLEFDMLSLHTGEDIQLSFALQKVGIQSWKPEKKGQWNLRDIPGAANANASYTKNQAPRELLFCKLLKAGFKTLKCSNCNNHKIIEKCIESLESRAKQVEMSSQLTDIQDNNNTVWTV